MKPADGGARDAPQPPSNDNSEGLKRREIAHGSGQRRTTGPSSAPAAAQGPSRVAKVAVSDPVDVTAHQPAASRVLERRAHCALPSFVRLTIVVGVGASDQSDRNHEHLEQPAPGHRTGPSSRAARSGNGVSIDFAAPLQTSCSEFCMAIQRADHHQHGGVDVSAAQLRSSTISMMAPSTTPSSTASAKPGRS